MEPAAMFEANHVILGFYRILALLRAQAHGTRYPVDLDRMMADRLAKEASK